MIYGGWGGGRERKGDDDASRLVEKSSSRAPTTTQNRVTVALRQPVFFRGGLNSCSVRVFINTGSRGGFVKSRARFTRRTEERRRRTCVTSDEGESIAILVAFDRIGLTTLFDLTFPFSFSLSMSSEEHN